MKTRSSLWSSALWLCLWLCMVSGRGSDRQMTELQVGLLERDLETAMQQTLEERRALEQRMETSKQLIEGLMADEREEMRLLVDETRLQLRASRDVLRSEMASVRSDIHRLILSAQQNVSQAMQRRRSKQQDLQRKTMEMEERREAMHKLLLEDQAAMKEEEISVESIQDETRKERDVDMEPVEVDYDATLYPNTTPVSAYPAVPLLPPNDQLPVHRDGSSTFWLAVLSAFTVLGGSVAATIALARHCKDQRRRARRYNKGIMYSGYPKTRARQRIVNGHPVETRQRRVLSVETTPLDEEET